MKGVICTLGVIDLQLDDGEPKYDVLNQSQHGRSVKGLMRFESASEDESVVDQKPGRGEKSVKKDW